MIYPAINDLLEKVGSRYVLVNVVAKRARELVKGVPAFIQTSEKKPVTVSTLEVYGGIVSYEPAKHVHECSAEEDAALLTGEATVASQEETAEKLQGETAEKSQEETAEKLQEETAEESQKALAHELEEDSLEEKDEEQ